MAHILATELQKESMFQYRFESYGKPSTLQRIRYLTSCHQIVLPHPTRYIILKRKLQNQVLTTPAPSSLAVVNFQGYL
jgi:hypothetical protein